jgi:hypothetical protein
MGLEDVAATGLTKESRFGVDDRRVTKALQDMETVEIAVETPSSLV